MRAISLMSERLTVGWKAGILAGLFLAVYAPLLPGLMRDWLSHPILSHGFAIPLISAFFVWSKRQALRALPAQPSAVGLGILSVGLTLSALGQAGGEPFLTRISLVVALLGLIWSVAGWPFTRPLLFPIGYLLFMIPPPFVVIKTAMSQARLIDATIAAAILRGVGVPVFREANLLHLPNMTLEVADPCSSVLAIAALSALACAYAFITEKHILVRIFLIVSAFPLAVASNIFRIVILSAGVYNLGPVAVQYITEQTYGLINFLLFAFFLVLLDRGLSLVFYEASRVSVKNAS